MAKVTFCFENGNSISTESAAGEKLLDTARRAGVSVDAPCNGNGSCGKCRMKILSGRADAPSTRHISPEEYASGWRLACSTEIGSDISVSVPASASAFKTGIRTADASILKSFTPLFGTGSVYSLPVALDEPTLEDTMPDAERLERAVEALTGKAAVLTLTVLRKLALLLRENGFAARLVLTNEGDSVRVLDILPPQDSTPVCGIAVDVGTTTVSAALANLEDGSFLAGASAGNGQIRYGADVINRIIESTRTGGSARLRRAITDETLVPLIDRLCMDSGVSKDRVYRLVVAGNTTMEHLLLGLWSDPVRMEPFVPSFFRFGKLRAADVISGLSPEASLLLAPNTGSYVGGDITAGVLATRLWESEETTLFIDLGTNGELVLGNSDYMMCCACSAGPAFEGGDISCGMRATDGAVQAVSIDGATMEPVYSIIGDEGQKPAGLCGSGIIDMIAELFRTGIIDSKGKFVREGKRVSHDEHGMGRFTVAFPEESASGLEVSLNEGDIDNFIRAKGAVFSAIQLLLGQLGFEPDCVDHILIAGGIGGGINFENAIRTGMLPDIDRDKYRYIGNSSLSGAWAMLLSDDAAVKTDELAANMTYVELSNEPGYMDCFISACFLPHTDSSLFPSVIREVL